jgi:ATP-dependent helicase/DNAse subunit B
MLCKQAEVLGIDNVIASQSHPSGWQAADKAEIHRLQTEIANNSRFLKSLYESLVTHDITREEYRELKAGYEAKIAALSEKERELRDNMVERMAEESKKAKAAANLRGVIQVDDLNADKIDKLIEKILVFEDTRIEVYFKFNDGIAVIGGGCGEHDKHIEQAG